MKYLVQIVIKICLLLIVMLLHCQLSLFSHFIVSLSHYCHLFIKFWVVGAYDFKVYFIYRLRCEVWEVFT